MNNLVAAHTSTDVPHVLLMKRIIDVTQLRLDVVTTVASKK